MIRFTMYRRGELPETHTDVHKNASDDPQFEGVVFSDGRCAIRWLTPIRSISVWDSFEDVMAIHGHPEYESELIWHDPPETISAEELALYGKGNSKTLEQLKRDVLTD